MTKEEVKFEHPAKGKDHCKSCKFFRKDHCAIVKGDIKPEDWCEEFHA
jgi:hypothetical protein